MSDERFSLAELPRRLREYSGQRFTYATLHRKAMAGDIPASREGGRWHIAAADLPLIAQVCKAESDSLPRRITAPLGTPFVQKQKEQRK